MGLSLDIPKEEIFQNKVVFLGIQELNYDG